MNAVNVKGQPSSLKQRLKIESPLKMMKNAFYFMPKALFIRYLHIYPDFLLMQENGWIRRLRFISRFMKPQAEQQMITINTSPNISRSKCSQAMKFGQLTEYNMRNVF